MDGHRSTVDLPPAPSNGALAGLWGASIACLTWALVVMLGHTSTQGSAVPAGGVLLGFTPAAVGLAWAIALLRRAWRAAPFGARFWVALPPSLLLGYLCLGGLVALADALA